MIVSIQEYLKAMMMELHGDKVERKELKTLSSIDEMKEICQGNEILKVSLVSIRQVGFNTLAAFYDFECHKFMIIFFLSSGQWLHILSKV